MIKFFRHIRKSLLEQNKMGKYFKYAIGEILLVVIGILIALQINNWNDRNKSTSIEFEYYNRLLKDFDLDMVLIEKLKKEADHRINVSNILLKDLDSLNKKKEYLLNNFLISLRSDAYIPRDVTFKDLISSGNLNILKDIELKNSLIQYYSELENKTSQLEQNRQAKIDMSFDLVNTEPGFGMYKLNYMKNAIDEDLMTILPNSKWHLDRESTQYKKFQMMILFNIAMADREKQHLRSIENLMQTPYQFLEQKTINQ